MTETASEAIATNGKGGLQVTSHPSVDEVKRAQAIINADRAAKRASKPKQAVPSISAIGETLEAGRKWKVSKSPCQFQSLPTNALFSLSADGSILCIKKSRSAYINLTTSRSEKGGSGDVWRVFF